MTKPDWRRVTVENGLASGFDDAWHEQWWFQMEETGGNIISSYRMRMVEADAEHVVMEMPFQPAARQGTGVFAAGAIIQLADVGATSVCFEWMKTHVEGADRDNLPFPLSVQISTNLIRNTDHGKITSESRIIHGGRRMMVVESTVKDEDGRLLATVTSTHMVASRPA